MRPSIVRLLSLALLLGPTAAVAEPTNLQLQWVGTFQSADDDHSADEYSSTADLFLDADMGPGRWHVWVEAATTPQDAGVSTFYPSANEDVGTALGKDGGGRVQISTLRYALPLSDSTTLHTGLLDPTNFIDASGSFTSDLNDEGIANNETSQFLAGPFVNNPTIDFPDYTLGVAIDDYAKERAIGGQLMIASSNGLADNPQASYGQLFNVDEHDKGVFAAGEAYLHQGATLFARLGGWTNSREHRAADGTHLGHNYGAYAVVDGRSTEGNGVNLRFGWANPDVSDTRTFASIAGRLQAGPAVLGAALGHSQASARTRQPTPDGLQAEVYSRFTIGDVFHISPDIQYLAHLAADTQPLADDHVMVYGVRLNLTLPPS